VDEAGDVDVAGAGDVGGGAEEVEVEGDAGRGVWSGWRLGR